jgi:hypothetical protein
LRCTQAKALMRTEMIFHPDAAVLVCEFRILMNSIGGWSRPRFAAFKSRRKCLACEWRNTLTQTAYDGVVNRPYRGPLMMKKKTKA